MYSKLLKSFLLNITDSKKYLCVCLSFTQETPAMNSRYLKYFMKSIQKEKQTHCLHNSSYWKDDNCTFYIIIIQIIKSTCKVSF